MTRSPTPRSNRSGERRPFEGAVTISFQSRTGENITVRARCADLSDAGAKIVCDPPIDLRTNVFVQAPAYGLMGNASVRYCRRSGTKHVVGLLFSAPPSQGEQGRRRLAQAEPEK